MCSACAGDYEDPDRAAWVEDAVDEGDEEGDGSGKLPHAKEALQGLKPL